MKSPAAVHTPPPYHTENVQAETWIWSDEPRRLIARVERSDDAEFIVKACNATSRTRVARPCKP
jgi:hypothetical protein